MLIFTGGFAIAVDQIRERDSKLTTSETALATIKKELSKTKSERDNYQRFSAKIAKGVDDLKAAHDTVVAAYQSEIEGYKARAAVSHQINQALLDNPPRAAPPSAPVYASTPMPSAPVIPAWWPPAPSVVTKAIRTNAVAEHKDNYPSMNYEIERQTEAYEKLLRFYKTADPFIKAAINKAALEYGTNYSSFAYDVERQIEARLKLDRR